MNMVKPVTFKSLYNKTRDKWGGGGGGGELLYSTVTEHQNKQCYLQLC